MHIKDLPKDLCRKTQIKEFVWLWELVVIWIIGLRMEKFNLEESTCYIPQRTVIWKIFTSFFPSSNNLSVCPLTPSSSPASPHGRQLLKAASAPLRSPLLIYPPSCLGLQKLGRVPAGTVFSAQRYKATGIGNSTNNTSKLWAWMLPRNRYPEREQLCVTDPACVSISPTFLVTEGAVDGSCCLPPPKYRVPGGCAAMARTPRHGSLSERASEASAGSEEESF